MFENWVLRCIFGPKEEEVKVGGEDCIMSIFMDLIFAIFYSVHQIFKNEKLPALNPLCDDG